MDVEISKNTLANWRKLGKGLNSDALTKRANKTLSRSRVIPKEYFTSPSSTDAVASILAVIDTKGYDDMYSVCYSLCVNVLTSYGIGQVKLEKFRQKFGGTCNTYEDLLKAEIPKAESDPVGIIYQCLQTEGEKNVRGSYFTPTSIVKEFAVGIKSGDSVLDPACGSGGILKEIETSTPECLYGCDVDPVCVMICSCNLLVKYLDCDFEPNILCCDFLGGEPFGGMRFDFIITNPPWGARVTCNLYEPAFNDSFSYFLHHGLKMLGRNGHLRFVLPEAVLNVKAHSDIRGYLAGDPSLTIEKIRMYGACFSKVYTKVIGLFIRRSVLRDDAAVHVVGVGGEAHSLDYSAFTAEKFRTCTEKDLSLIRSVYEVPHESLKDGSLWALGIVTGSNKSKLLDTQENGSEKIYTGSQVRPYVLNPAEKYIDFKNGVFQQVANESLYRTSPKLVYKFISSKLVFAIDTEGSLVLNSVNIVIPNLKHMGIYSVLAFLNSELFEYLNLIEFSQLKVLKGNLQKLPFPLIDEALDEKLSFLTSEVINGSSSAHNTIQDIVYKVFKLDCSQIAHIKRNISR